MQRRLTGAGHGDDIGFTARREPGVQLGQHVGHGHIDTPFNGVTGGGTDLAEGAVEAAGLDRYEVDPQRKP